MKPSSARRNLICSMVIFGTIGLFVRNIPLPSSVIAMCRGLLGGGLLLLLSFIRGSRPNGSAIRKNLPLLLLSGVFIGFNWILLFEAYRYTTVATATLCYYLSPSFLLLLAPVFLKERLTGRKLLCACVALAGMIPVSGILSAGFRPEELRGVALGVGAALLYASIIVMNKSLGEISAWDRTMVQLLTAGAAMIPYILLTGGFAGLSLTLTGGLWLGAVSLVHTGLAYVLYFGSLLYLPAQTAGILSYLDPVVAVLLSALILREPLTPLTAVGAVLILGAAIIAETEKRPAREATV